MGNFLSVVLQFKGSSFFEAMEHVSRDRLDQEGPQQNNPHFQEIGKSDLTLHMNSLTSG